MEYLTASEIAAKWNVSEQLVRRHCRENRIPNAYQEFGTWYIPADAEKPARKQKEVKPTPILLKKILKQRDGKQYRGFYEYLQINMVYSSGRMASNRLTRNQIEVLYKSGYLPSTSIRTFMPKANGLSRMYTLLTIEDQIVYQAYANVIAEALLNVSQIKNRYKKSVFGNLYSGKESIFFYQKWQDSYKAYTKSIIKSYERGNKYIASFDLTACYDSINHRLLYDILTKKCHLSDNCAKSFVQLLEKWESADRMELGTGIPQGPQASGIVAEAVLAEYDSFIEGLQKNLSFQYFRYVDDIRILAKDEKTVQWVLFLLDVKSKELGLFPQSSKIVIHEVTNIDNEIKRISKPLFDDEFDDEKNAEIAVKAIQKMLKDDPADLTTIKRYFRYAVQITGAAFVIDDEGGDAMTEAFFEHDQTAYPPVAIFVWTDTLKFHMEVQYVLKVNSFNFRLKKTDVFLQCHCIC